MRNPRSNATALTPPLDALPQGLRGGHTFALNRMFLLFMGTFTEAVTQKLEHQKLCIFWLYMFCRTVFRFTNICIIITINDIDYYIKKKQYLYISVLYRIDMVLGIFATEIGGY